MINELKKLWGMNDHFLKPNYDISLGYRIQFMRKIYDGFKNVRISHTQKKQIRTNLKQMIEKQAEYN